MTSRPFPPSSSRASCPLALVHLDLIELPVESYYRERYCLTILDDYSGFGAICPMQSKSQTAVSFRAWVTWAETQSGSTLKAVRSDRGGEFMASSFRTFLVDKGAEHQLSVADHPQQNGRAERFNRTLMDKEESLRQYACRDQLACGSQQGGVGELSWACRRSLP